MQLNIETRLLHFSKILSCMSIYLLCRLMAIRHKLSFIQIPTAIFLLFTFSVESQASTISYWVSHYWNNPPGFSSPRYSTHIAACDHLRKTIYYYQVRIYDVAASNQYYCRILDKFTGYKETVGVATKFTQTCPNGHTGLECNVTPPACEYGFFDPRSNKCVAASSNGPADDSQACSNEPSPLVGNPINFVSGNKFHQEIYYRSAQPEGISFQRYYNSSDSVWRHSYSDKLTFQADQVVLTLGSGKVLHFWSSGVPKDSAAAAYGELRAQDGGWLFLAKNKTTYEFDAQGRLVTVRSQSGKAQHLSYVPINTSIHVFVEDDFGNQINFKQSSSGGLYALSADGMTMSFAHANEQLIKTIKTINGQQFLRQYHYEDSYNSQNLTGITDERGVRYATWKYDTQGRAISSEHTGGTEKVLIGYNSDGSSTVTNELGKRTTYRFQIIDGSKKITAIEGEPSANCPNSNSSFTYDDRGLLKTKTDNKGHLTTYDYNDRGLEISRTEAAGTPQARTVTTDWHPTLFLPVTVTEPTQITHYTYDDQGRQLSQSVTQR